MNVISRAIVLNLSDGITTPVSYLLPAILISGQFYGKALVIGTIGAAVSMAFAFKSSESTKGTWWEWLVAFICSGLGGILPILSFILFSKPFAAVLTGFIIIVGIFVISNEKRAVCGWKRAIWDTAKNIFPALIVVGLLSII
jgi:VIT1/CCC1 family predicted Fe2+/Mn2+ transporter